MGPKLTVIEGGAAALSPTEQAERDLERILEKLDQQKKESGWRQKGRRASKKSWRP